MPKFVSWAIPSQGLCCLFVAEVCSCPERHLLMSPAILGRYSQGFGGPIMCTLGISWEENFPGCMSAVWTGNPHAGDSCSACISLLCPDSGCTSTSEGTAVISPLANMPWVGAWPHGCSSTVLGLWSPRSGPTLWDNSCSNDFRCILTQLILLQTCLFIRLDDFVIGILCTGCLLQLCTAATKQTKPEHHLSVSSVRQKNILQK